MAIVSVQGLDLVRDASAARFEQPRRRVDVLVESFSQTSAWVACSIAPIDIFLESK